MIALCQRIGSPNLCLNLLQTCPEASSEGQACPIVQDEVEGWKGLLFHGTSWKARELSRWVLDTLPYHPCHVVSPRLFQPHVGLSTWGTQFAPESQKLLFCDGFRSVDSTQINSWLKGNIFACRAARASC